MSQRTLPRLRLASQVFFFGLFLFLLFRTEFHGSFQASGGPVRLPWPVGLFLEADPLVAIANVAVDARALPRPALEPRRPGAHVLPRAILLRLDLPARHR